MDNTQDLDEHLADVIYDNNRHLVTKDISPYTKELMIKDAYRKWMEDANEALNNVYPDIKFDLKIVRIRPYVDFSPKPYETKWASDDYVEPYKFSKHQEFNPNTDDGYTDWGFERIGLSEMGLEIGYTLSQECSLGHTHYKRRYHMFSPAQWLCMITHWNLGMRGKEFIAEYIKDFFYDSET